MKKQVFEENGVIFSCAAAKAGETVEIIYTGLLKNSGATDVKVHIGYNELWENAETIDMELKDDAFVASVKIAQAGSLNCAFVDSIGNWDNNSGVNYSLAVAKKTSRKTTTTRARKTAETEEASATKKAAAKKTTKTTAKKATATKKATTTKTAAKKTTTAKKTTSSKAASTKTTTAKKTAAKKVTAAKPIE